MPPVRRSPGGLPGGGVALLRAQVALEILHGDNADQECGIAILLRALEEPLRQLAENAGIEASVVLERLVDAG